MSSAWQSSASSSLLTDWHPRPCSPRSASSATRAHSALPRCSRTRNHRSGWRTSCGGAVAARRSLRGWWTCSGSEAPAWLPTKGLSEGSKQRGAHTTRPGAGHQHARVDTVPLMCKMGSRPACALQIVLKSFGTKHSLLQLQGTTCNLDMTCVICMHEQHACFLHRRC
jgi:hypothetical protein